MPNPAEPHDHTISSIYDQIEDEAELIADDPEMADRLHNYSAFLATAGLLPWTVTSEAEVVLRHLAALHRGIVAGVHDLLDVVRRTAYNEGFEYAANLPADDDGEDDGYDPGCCIF